MLRLPLSILFLGVIGIAALSAQDLHIYYDAYQDSLYYMQGGKPVDRPAVRKGNNVVLHVSNFNNYLYDVQVKTPGAGMGSAQRSAANMGSMLSLGGANPFKLFFGAGNPLTGISGLLNGLTSSSSSEGKDFSSGFASALTPSASEMDQEQLNRLAELKQQASLFDAALQRIESRAEEIFSLQQEMETVLESIRVQTFAAGELERLRLNPQLEPRLIKQFSAEYIKTIFGRTDPAQLGLDRILEAADRGAGLVQIKQRYAAHVAQYAEETNVIKISGAAFADQKFNFPGSNILQWRTSAGNAAKTATENLHTYQSNLQAIEANPSAIMGLDPKQLSELRTDYLVLMGNDFSKIYRQTASEEDMSLQLVFTPLDSVGVKGVATKTVNPIEVNVFGGIQIKPSIGLGFGQFFNRPQTFFVRDSLIRSSDKDVIAPYLASYIHFHPKGRRETSIGGALGIGVPIGSSSVGFLDAITFFLGPSIALGRNQGVVLNAGIMGGRVSQLANGYLVGDHFEGPTELLQTEPVYRLGYTFGISFKLANL